MLPSYFTHNNVSPSTALSFSLPCNLHEALCEAIILIKLPNIFVSLVSRLWSSSTLSTALLSNSWNLAGMFSFDDSLKLLRRIIQLNEVSDHLHFMSKISNSVGWKHLLTHVSVWQGQYLSNEIAEQEDKDSFNWKSTMNLNLQQIVTLHFVFWVDLRLEKLYFLIFSALSLLFAISIGAVCFVWTSQKGKNI